MAAAARKVPPMTVAVAPSWLSRSGASTSTTPKASPASRVSHRPTLTLRSRSAGQAARSPCGSARCGRGTKNATTIRAAPATAAPAKAGPVPTLVATVPTSGPKSAPTTAAPRAKPSSSPRRSSGAAVASQPSPAAQVQAPASPWTNRAESSTIGADAKPNTSVAALIRASPSSTTSRFPSREASSPPGRAPTSVPSG